jgi:catechol 2,3-dioxygenase-like lactoylglutathione lyase family enzyme
VFDHVSIRVSDRAASERFYDTVLAVLDKPRRSRESFTEWGEDFSIIADDGPVAERLHIAFYAPSHELVDAFHQAGVDAGFSSDGAPGPRDYTPEYYGSFLLDPDGNSVEAVYVDEDRTLGQVDHLWLRTPDPEPIAAFYEVQEPILGIEVRRHSPDHVQIVGERGSFSYIRGERPTRHVHIAFKADTDETVDAFHAAATAAGYTDNGAPGERSKYHPGYYGAFVLDPDGHNIEAVNHNR